MIGLHRFVQQMPKNTKISISTIPTGYSLSLEYYNLGIDYEKKNNIIHVNPYLEEYDGGILQSKIWSDRARYIHNNKTELY